MENELDFTDKKKIGQGSSGITYKIRNTKDNNYYLLKEIFLVKDEDIKKSENEANILKSINHNNIVKYYESYREDNSFFILMEYCEKSNLEDFIKQHKKENKLIDKNLLYYIILDICSGLKEIHNKKIIHRDLKPNNIFISKDYKIKIGDFGISKILRDSDYTNTNYIGTLGYMAPELLNNEKYNNKADIWSLGCIIYELCTLNACFDTNNNIGVLGLLNKIKECEYEKNQLLNDSDWKNIIENLLKKNYNDRPDINELYDLVVNMGHINITIEQKYINSLDEISRNFFIERIINEKQVNIIETNLELVKPKLIQFIEANSFKRKMKLLFQILEELKITKKQDKYESICSTLEGTLYNKNFVSEFLKEQKVIETLYKILEKSKVEKKNNCCYEITN